MPDIWSLTNILVTFGLYVGILTSTGLVLNLLVFRIHFTRIEVRIRRDAIWFACLGLLCSIIVFAVQAIRLSGDIWGMIDPDMLGLLWQTQAGSVLTLRALGTGLLFAGLLSRVLSVSLVGAGLALWSFVQIGHIAGTDRFLLQIGLFLHVALASFWLGVLMPLRRLMSAADLPHEAAIVGHRFGRIATGAVPILLVLGLLMSWHLVGSVEALFSTGYGVVLLGKTSLVTCILSLAGANKFIFVPRLRAGQTKANSWFAHAILAEWIVMLGVLAITATLTTNLELPT